MRGKGLSSNKAAIVVVVELSSDFAPPISVQRMEDKGAGEETCVDDDAVVKSWLALLFWLLFLFLWTFLLSVMV
jgi:hypothetical protein